MKSQKNLNKAREKASEAKNYWRDSEKLATQNAKAAGQKLTPQEASRAGKIIQMRRISDTSRTATRVEAVVKREEKKAAKSRMVNAVSGGAAKPKSTSPLRKAEVKAVKAGAKAAKSPTTMSKTARGSSQMSAEYNAGYISGKKDIAAFKRNQGKKK
jgi:hypothetical protein